MSRFTCSDARPGAKLHAASTLPDRRMLDHTVGFQVDPELATHHSMFVALGPSDRLQLRTDSLSAVESPNIVRKL